MICPVSVMEKNPYFRYLPAPFAFAAYHIVQAKHAEKTKLLELNDSDLKKRTEGVGYFWYYFGQKTTSELRDKIRKDRETLALLQEKMASLEKYFAKASAYHKGVARHPLRPEAAGLDMSPSSSDPRDPCPGKRLDTREP